MSRAPMADFDDALASSPAPDSWQLRLYVTGCSPKCMRAAENLRRACEEHLGFGRE